MFKVYLTLAGLGFLVGGCASFREGAPEISPAMTKLGQASGDSFEKLVTGRRLLATRCTTCHALEPVSKYTVEEWGGIVEDMADRSGLKEEEENAIQAYLTTVRKTL
ncbi:hypothetical protein EBU02_01100 [bacterium]|jgi:uncharacterized membrane protein|nr:hypothetical protein [bacterium]